MKYFSLFLFCFTCLFQSQTRAIYEYRFSLDSTKVDSLSSEWMYLDISEKGSRFYSKLAYESDSLAAVSLQKQVASGSTSFSITRGNAGKVGDRVEKSYPDYKVVLVTRIGSEKYRVVEDRRIEWQILPEQKTFGEFKAQKAVGSFAGRNWTAWFSTEVPIQDGPYKLHGLPGLIVSAQDDSGTHNFELKGIKKMEIEVGQEVKMADGSTIPLLSDKALEISRDVYKKQYEQYKKDPVKDMREMLARPNTKVVVNMNGRELSNSADILRQMEQNRKKSLNSQNNPIELEL